MIDMLPSIKLSTIRNSTTLEVSILVGVCVATKFVSLILVNTKDSVSLGKALTVLAHKRGMPAVIFTDPPV